VSPPPSLPVRQAAGAQLLGVGRLRNGCSRFAAEILDAGQPASALPYGLAREQRRRTQPGAIVGKLDGDAEESGESGGEARSKAIPGGVRTDASGGRPRSLAAVFCLQRDRDHKAIAPMRGIGRRDGQRGDEARIPEFTAVPRVQSKEPFKVTARLISLIPPPCAADSRSLPTAQRLHRAPAPLQNGRRDGLNLAILFNTPSLCGQAAHC
jgi:hypothetical protein